jgi:hypothetical protein
MYLSSLSKPLQQICNKEAGEKVYVVQPNRLYKVTDGEIVGCTLIERSASLHEDFTPPNTQNHGQTGKNVKYPMSIGMNQQSSGNFPIQNESKPGSETDLMTCRNFKHLNKEEYDFFRWNNATGDRVHWKEGRFLLKDIPLTGKFRITDNGEVLTLDGRVSKENNSTVEFFEGIMLKEGALEKIRAKIKSEFSKQPFWKYRNGEMRNAWVGAREDTYEIPWEDGAAVSFVEGKLCYISVSDTLEDATEVSDADIQKLIGEYPENKEQLQLQLSKKIEESKMEKFVETQFEDVEKDSDDNPMDEMDPIDVLGVIESDIIEWFEEAPEQIQQFIIDYQNARDFAGTSCPKINKLLAVMQTIMDLCESEEVVTLLKEDEAGTSNN